MPYQPMHIFFSRNQYCILACYLIPTCIIDTADMYRSTSIIGPLDEWIFISLLIGDVGRHAMHGGWNNPICIGGCANPFCMAHVGLDAFQSWSVGERKKPNFAVKRVSPIAKGIMGLIYKSTLTLILL